MSDEIGPPIDDEEFDRQLIELLRGYVTREIAEAVQPLLDRIAALEAANG